MFDWPARMNTFSFSAEMAGLVLRKTEATAANRMDFFMKLAVISASSCCLER